MIAQCSSSLFMFIVSFLVLICNLHFQQCHSLPIQISTPSTPTFLAFQDINCSKPFNNSLFTLPPVIFQERILNATCTNVNSTSNFTKSAQFLTSLMIAPSNHSYAYNCSQSDSFTSFDYFSYRAYNCSTDTYVHIEMNTAGSVFDCLPAIATFVEAGFPFSIPIYAQVDCPASNGSSHNVALAVSLGIGALVLVTIVTAILFIRKRRKDRRAATDTYARL